MWNNILCLCVTDDRWDFVGNTVVTNNYVRLTADRQSQQGAIWSTVVCCHCAYLEAEQIEFSMFISQCT